MEIAEIGRRINEIEAAHPRGFANAMVLPRTRFSDGPPLAVVTLRFETEGARVELRGEGPDWQAAFDNLDENRKLDAARRRTNLAKRMALAIIEAHYDDGACTDRRLRLCGFKQAQIIELRETAEKIANGMGLGLYRVTIEEAA